jgi:cytochrome c biogenesis protein CcmG/thiol:disulfide interchange protein DsbE
VPRSAPQDSASPAPEPRRKWRFSRVLFVLPVLGFVGLLGAFRAGLDYNPRLVPSPLIGKRVPEFALPPIAGGKPGLSSRDLVGRVSLVNVFASWCVTCRDEQPLLVALKEHRIVPIEGIDYEDDPADAARWLAQMGNPYERIGADRNGRVAIDWGVYGVPESFLVNREGRIAYKVIGAITPDVLERTLLPKIDALRKIEAAATTKEDR